MEPEVYKDGSERFNPVNNNPFCSKFFINNPNSNPTIIPIKIFQCIASFFIILIFIFVKPNIKIKNSEESF
jgi:hypothetical protein